MLVTFIPFFLLGSSFAAPAAYNSRAPSTSSQTIQLEKRSPRNRGAYNASERRSMIEQDLLAAEQKYGVCTEEKMNLSKRGTSNSVKLTATPRDFGFFGTINLGTPSVEYSFIMDTGSADLVVLSAPCTSGCLPTTNLYKPASSSTGSSISSNYKIQYGTGSASGTVRSDVASFAGIAIPSQRFAAVTDSYNLAATSSVSGIAGLAWSALSGSGAVPFLERLWDSGSLKSPVFGFAFTSSGQYSMEETAGGVMNVGFTNSSLYTGAINYISSPSKVYWDIPIDNVGVNGGLLGISAPRVTIDTGSSNIYVPVAVANAIYAKIPGGKAIGNGLYTYPCTSSVKLTFTFGGISYPISDDIFNLSATDISGVTCYGAVNSIGSSSGGQDQWIVGDAFLRNVYVAFQFSPPAVGFAPLATAASVATTPTVVIPVTPSPMASAIAIETATDSAVASTPLNPANIIQNAMYSEIAKAVRATYLLVKGLTQ